MTPNTTPAPMTHEAAVEWLDRKIAEHANSAYTYGSEAGYQRVRAYIESQRARADALAARISELEAGIGRLAAEWEAKALTSRAVRDRALMLRATELRSLIGHKEGNGDG